MSLAEKFSHLVERAEESVEYWRDVAIMDFTRDLHARMERLGNVSHAELARRMGVSRPHVSQLLDGGNFTLNTMVKVATALGGVLRVHIADRDTVTIWKDSYSAASSDSDGVLRELAPIAAPSPIGTQMSRDRNAQWRQRHSQSALPEATASTGDLSLRQRDSRQAKLPGAVA